MTRRRLRLAAAAPLALAFALVALAGGTAAVAQPPAGTSPKLRSDLAALVQGRQTLDPRIASLVAGYRSEELPFFAVLGVILFPRSS